jgi:hypothetical protein
MGDILERQRSTKTVAWAEGRLKSLTDIRSEERDSQIYRCNNCT